jgi:hypothetical protein
VSTDDDDLPPEPPPQPRIEAVIEDCEFLADTGETFMNAARRLGYANAKTLDRTLWRARRGDLVARLKANEASHDLAA